jgi:opacity protein-like surface antigen
MRTVENVQPNPGTPQGGIPTWDEQKQFFRMRNWFRILVAVVVILWVALIIWVLAFAPITDAQAAQLDVGATMAMVLAPVLAAAAAVERTLETTFNVIEGSWRTMIAYLGRGLRWLKSAETEVKQARQFLADVSNKFNQEMENIPLGQISASALTADMQARMEIANRMLSLAQERLKDAEGNLAAVTSSDSYIRAKASASIIVGLMLGVIIAGLGQLQMFAMLGIGLVPQRIDVLITGLVIGSGSYPVHSLVGILQQGKDTLDSVKGYFNRSAPQAQATEQRITTMGPPAAPGGPVQVQQAVIETTTAQSTEETPGK